MKFSEMDRKSQLTTIFALLLGLTVFLLLRFAT